MFEGKKILITGGTGSFGKTILNNFLKFDFDEIRIFSRDEKKQEDLRLKLNDSRLRFYIGDVRDFSSIYDGCKKVDYVFHAAALKQVPSCEFYPHEAFKTNVIGSENLMNAAIQNNVSKVVLLSTDKAVYPINAMGISKAMMEKIMIAKARTLNEKETTLVATRYGNVMGSRGSVIPLFISQIKNKKPITVTDPKMTRFLMSLQESINLVLFAFEKGKQGDIYVQKSSACSIEILAKALKKLFKSNVPIDVLGTRHGEKLYETLVSREEMARATNLKNYYSIQADNRNLNYENYFVYGQKNISEIDDYTSHNTYQMQLDEVIDVLKSLDFVKREL
tara:strand:- start:725 stop:1729 length:1005 start_codon:yes stop_codon:yes gene_type:complete